MGTDPHTLTQGLKKNPGYNSAKLSSCCCFTGDQGETLKVMDGWCHAIVTVGVNKRAQQPIFSAGSITHLARRLRLSAELATIRQTPVVILQHTWTGEDLQGDEGSGRSALPTNAPQFKSHSLEACGGADLKEDPLLCAPPCAVVMLRLCGGKKATKLC